MILGVDPGVSGALAFLRRDGALDRVEDMPTMPDGPKGRRAANPALLASLIAPGLVSAAYVELVGPRPDEGAVGAFSFGRGYGAVLGVLAARGVPVRFIAPASWKRTIGLKTADKGAARSEAVRRWPTHASLFARIKDDGRAESALIAVAGMIGEKISARELTDCF